MILHHGTCSRDGCSRLAVDADIDHDRPWAHGGNTNLADLRPLCPRDHVHRHRTKAIYRTRPDHTVEITTPTGFTSNPPHPSEPHAAAEQHRRTEWRPGSRARVCEHAPSSGARCPDVPAAMPDHEPRCASARRPSREHIPRFRGAPVGTPSEISRSWGSPRHHLAVSRSTTRTRRRPAPP
ncbi:HNH endonuclease signature motif containing protein [Microbacterium sp. ZW T5_45]|uniref:HNH endonuclease signature motif containing protein n=1 Tax=Microbacterium sp. ZW T5_45 TaxID=3378080 RepID=UPI003851D270